MEDYILFLKTLISNVKNPAFYSLWTVIAIQIAFFIIYTLVLQIPLPLLALTILAFIGINATITRTYYKIASANAETKFDEQMTVALTEYLKDSVIVYDANFKIITINPATEEMFNISKEMVVNTQVNPGMVKNRGMKMFTQILFPSLAPGVTQVSEISAWPQVVKISTDEPQLELLVTTNKILDENGETTGFIKLVKDQTREASILRTKNEFIDVAAHQLRTPLTALHWMMEGIVKTTESLNPELHQMTQEGLQVAERALKITNDLLDVSKIEDGRFGYAPQNINLSDVVNIITKEMGHTAKRYSVELIDATRENNIGVYADGNSVGMALMNLVDNAIRYNIKNGKVTILAEKTADGKSARISVSDTGIGIPDEDMKKLFGKLHRGSNAIQMEPNGNGLGLYIAKNIIERNGGKIGVESVLNRGSTFWFTLPVSSSM